MPKIDEWHIQRALRIFLDGVPERGIAGHALPGVEWWHTPNSGEGRSAFQGKRLKDAGVKPGVHDVLAYYQRQLYALELKDDEGVLSPEQISWGRRMAAQGALVAWANSLPAARAQLFAWGLTKIC